MPDTVTDPSGVVHVLEPSPSVMTICNRDASGRSRAITIAQLAGLVLNCEACNA